MKVTRIIKGIGVFTTALFVSVLAVYLYSPVLKSNAASTALVDLNISVSKILSFSSDTEKVEMGSSVNSFVHKPMNLTVATNSVYGYTLTLEDADDNSNMVHENTNIKDVFTSDFEGAKTSADMPENSWGFSIDGGSNYYYIPVRNFATLVSKSNSVLETGSATATVDFGVKVGVPASGVYSDTVLFTAYANGVGGTASEGNAINERGAKPSSSMQNFDCSTLESGKTVTLYDIRDNNAYTVKKLVDGNCWMTQNLRIQNRILTSADSDLEVDTPIMSSSTDRELTDVIVEFNKYVDTVNLSNPDELQAYYEKFDTEVLPIMLRIDDFGGHYSDQLSFGGMRSAYRYAGHEGTIPTSICPKNWRLPTESEFEALSTAYGDAPSLIEAANVSLAGEYVTTGTAADWKLVYNGNMAHYITSTVKSLNGGYFPVVFHIDTSKTQSEAAEGNYNTVRCVAR
ncbi:hypothetical protein J6X90_03305 [Candidatus Saccharibacteria bacterium]|nr:hypothetical protein [Candidatus Saccharibacteria bacterium]